MARFIDLKYEGKLYTEVYDINNILIKNKFNWFLDCELENMRIEILKDTLIINAGIFYNGLFEYGVIRDVDWINGIFENGVIYNGIFKYIEVKNGIIFNGTFLNGSILKGDIKNGKFVNMDISSECRIDNSIRGTFIKTFEKFVNELSKYDVFKDEDLLKIIKNKERDNFDKFKDYVKAVKFNKIDRENMTDIEILDDFKIWLKTKYKIVSKNKKH